MATEETSTFLAVRIKKLLISIRDNSTYELPVEFREKLSQAVTLLNKIKSTDSAQRDALTEKISDLKVLRAHYDEVKHEQTTTHIKLNEMADSIPFMAHSIVDTLTQKITLESISLRECIDEDAKARDDGRNTAVDTSLVPTDLADELRKKCSTAKNPPPATPPNHPPLLQQNLVCLKGKDKVLTGSAILVFILPSFASTDNNEMKCL